MAEIVPNDKTGKRMDKMVIFEFDKLEKDKMRIVLIFFKCQKREKRAEEEGAGQRSRFLRFFLERERLLSSFPVNPTVGSRRDKKGSCSTRRGLRVGTGFKEFRQTSRGRGFILLGFYPLFKCFIMFRLV